MSVLPAVLAALECAAKRHAKQRRKGGPDAPPYINHLVEVVRLLAEVGGVEDAPTLQAAALHDTIEDTNTTPAELEQAFGAEVLALVLEVTDDKRLPKEERKRLQVDSTPRKSDRAKRIKIADKISNVREVAYAPPHDWTLERRMQYLDWAEAVVAGCRGASPELESHFDRLLEECRARLAGTTTAAG